MWSLVKAEFEYRWHIILVVLVLVILYPFTSSIFGDKSKITIALSYLSYSAGFASFMVVIELQNRAKQEYRNAMLNRLPLSAQQRTLVRLGPILFMILFCLLINIIAYFYLGELRNDVKIWTFISSLGWWSAAYFLWIWISEVIDSRSPKNFTYWLIIKSFVILAWLMIMLFVVVFPELFRDSLYTMNNALSALAVASLSFLLAWLRVKNKSNLLR